MRNIEELQDKYQVKFSIKYQTTPGQNMYIMGSLKELGSWKESRFKLKWSEGHVWKGRLEVPESVTNFTFKFVCISEDNKYKRWEEGPNRIFDRTKFDKERIMKVDCMWEHFSISFNIYYPLHNEMEYMQIIGGPKEIGNWFREGGVPVKMSLTEPKTLNGITGKFWETKVFLRSDVENNFEFDYRFSIYNPIKNSAIWEREPNRKLKILTDYAIVQNQNGLGEVLQQVGREVELLTNSDIIRLDVNFVSHLKFDKIGDHNIYIGPYPQNEEDIQTMAFNGITAVINVQTDTDMVHRQVNWQNNLNSYKRHRIEIVRHPIRDFDQADLILRIKGASDVLKELLDSGKVVYVHCTAGMSRAAATVICYLVFYESYSLEEAYEYVKTHRDIICPNMGALAQVVKMNNGEETVY